MSSLDFLLFLRRRCRDEMAPPLDFLLVLRCGDRGCGDRGCGDGTCMSLSLDVESSRGGGESAKSPKSPTSFMTTDSVR